MFLSANIASAQAITGSCTSSNNCTDITKSITFLFGKTADSSINYDAGTNKVTFGQNISQVTLSDTEFSAKKFDLGTGTMTIDFNNTANDNQRSFTLNTENIFKGNIYILAGKGNQNGGEAKNGKFTANFGKNVEGNITLTSHGNFYNAVSHKNEITFQSTASLKGNLDASAGNNTITFENGNLEGNVSASAKYSTYQVAKNTIIFKGDSNKITGNVTASAGAYVGGYGTNDITFEKGGSIGTSGSNTITASGGNNTITFNSVSSDTNEDATINANINASTTSGGGYFTNIIAFNGTGTNTINGNITAQQSKNTITFGATTTSGVQNKANSTNSITGNITASGGTNEITLNTTDSTLAINGGITSNAGTNTIKADSGTLTIGKNSSSGTSKYSITANGGGTATNTISAKTLTIDVDKIEATGNYNSINKNEITSTTNGTLKTNTITASNGKMPSENKITFDENNGSIEVGSGGISASSGKNEIKANTITINGNVTSAWGNNTINATGAIKIGSQDKKVTISNDSNAATSNAKNTITGGDGSAIYADVKLLKGNDKVSNNITLNGNSSITGDITANAGTNNISIKGTATTSTTPSPSPSTLTTSADMSALKALVGLTGNITTNGGTNNIVFENKIWAPTALGNSGTLTTNGGTTNLVLRQTSSAISTGDLVPTYNINANGGTTNIVMQGPVSVSAKINYTSSSTTNLIFASSNDGGTTSASGNKTSGTVNDDFSGSNGVTNVANGKVLGVTYQDGVRLLLASYSSSVGGETIKFVDYYGDLFKQEDGTLLTLTTKRNTSSNVDEIDVQGLAIGGIFNLEGSTTSRTYNVNLKQNSAFVGQLAIDPDKSNITLKMESGAKFVLAGTGKSTATAKLQTLDLTGIAQIDTAQVLDNTFMQTNTIINIANDGNDNFTAPNRDWFRLLEIGSSTTVQNKDTAPVATTDGLKGSNGLFMVYVNDGANQSNVTLGSQYNNEQTKTNYGSVYADRIVVHSGDKGTNYIQTILDSSTDIYSIKHAANTGTETTGNIAVATVKGTGSEQVTKFESQNSIQGFDVISAGFVTETTDATGKYTNSGGYTTYFIGSVGSKGASTANQQASAAALGSNYDLYLANMNSLNKRMGELRENANSQGAWARIFNGMQTSNFSLETKALYTTFQAGYDYAFGFSGANNYLGFALSYANSLTSSNSSIDIDGSSKGIKDVTSNAIEFAIYNAYVQDGASKATGWKNGLY
ncbi:hypothetical protein CQA57_06800, partial [Helicobacter anseris]